MNDYLQKKKTIENFQKDLNLQVFTTSTYTFVFFQNDLKWTHPAVSLSSDKLELRGFIVLKISVRT